MNWTRFRWPDQKTHLHELLAACSCVVQHAVFLDGINRGYSGSTAQRIPTVHTFTSLTWGASAFLASTQMPK